MAAGQLSTTDRDHFHPKIRNGAELRKPLPCILRWGLAQSSAIEAQSILGGLASKIAMASPPSPYLGVKVSAIENSCNKIEQNWSTIESTRFDIEIRNGGVGAGETFHRRFIFRYYKYEYIP